MYARVVSIQRELENTSVLNYEIDFLITLARKRKRTCEIIREKTRETSVLVKRINFFFLQRGPRVKVYFFPENIIFLHHGEMVNKRRF